MYVLSRMTYPQFVVIRSFQAKRAAAYGEGAKELSLCRNIG
jgi:hypothetical protein